MSANYASLKTRLTRYGIISAHGLSTFLHNVDVDLSKLEASLAKQVTALTTKVDELQARLEAYDDSVVE
jgi:hypothetical protein